MESSSTERDRLGCKLDIVELGTILECALADSLEFFVADDAFKGGAVDECTHFDNFEIIGEGYTLEGVTVLECSLTDIFEVFVADDMIEGGAMAKRHLFNGF